MKHFILLFCALALVCNTAFSQKPAYRFKAGQDYQYLVEIKNERVQEVQGQTMSSTTESTISASLSIQKVQDSGTMDATVKIDNALVIVESDQGSQTLGSDAAGKSLPIAIQGNGDIEVADTNAAKALDQKHWVVFGQLMAFLPKLPGSKLALGEEWTDASEDSVGSSDDGWMITKNKRSYKVMGKETYKGKDCFKIEYKKNSEIGGSMVRGGQDMDVSGEIKFTGTIFHAIEEGVLVGFDGVGDSEQTITVKSQSMKVPISEKNTIKVELVK